MIYSVFFSPTRTNERSAGAMAEVLSKSLGDKVKSLNFTDPDNVTDVHMTKDDFAVFAAPVYGGRVYKGAMERFSHVRGNGTPCIAAVTYGNRDFDDALLELCDDLKARGFVPLGAFALIGEHTYGTIQEGRPDKNDLKMTADKTKEVLEKLKSGDLSQAQPTGNRPYREGGNGGKFHPHTDRESCIGCGICKSLCPERAIDDDFNAINDRCIACFACVKGCPVGAKRLGEGYDEFATEFSKKLAQRKENQYFINYRGTK